MVFCRPLIPAMIAAMVTIGFSQQAEAAHLVGGQITYVCTGSNNYSIALTVYRDCNSQGAQLDAVASIGVFNTLTGALISNLQVQRGPKQNIQPNTGNPCLTAPPNLCTEFAQYITSINLPPIAGGYTISFQRCCRNNTITNIYAPGTKGSTFTTTIPPNDSTCNNSPQWDNDPPIVLCNMENLNIPITATDLDGDSLSYRLCNLYFGGGQGGGSNLTSPAPNPPAGPPYGLIAYKPPSTTVNPIPGIPGLSMDPNTGYVNGFLNVTGQYVLAICVQEWRNGVLLNTIRRDYQFNVTPCDPTLWADIVSEEDDTTQLCIGSTINFQQTSFNVTSFHWDFGDTTITTDTSNLSSPTYTFNDTGTYHVMLIGNPGWSCADTDIVSFHIYPPINPTWFESGGNCLDEQGFLLTPQGNWYPNSKFGWTIGTPGDANYYTDSNMYPPPVTFVNPGTYPIKLYVKSKSCEEVYIDSLYIFNRPEMLGDFSGIIGCQPYTHVFDPQASADTDMHFLWDFGDGDTSHAAMPTHTYTQPGLYDIKVWMWTLDGCVDTLYQSFPGGVLVHPRPVMPFTVSPTTISIYQPDVEVTTTGIDPGEQFWIHMGDSSIYNQSSYLIHAYKDTGNFYVLRIAVNQFGCWDTLSQLVRVDPVFNIWSPTAFTPNGDGNNEQFRPVVTGFTNYRLVITNRWGQVVFQSNDALEAWNGTEQNQGKECPEGAYTWHLFVIDYGDSPVENNGVVLLMR